MWKFVLNCKLIWFKLQDCIQSLPEILLIFYAKEAGVFEYTDLNTSFQFIDVMVLLLCGSSKCQFVLIYYNEPLYFSTESLQSIFHLFPLLVQLKPGLHSLWDLKFKGITRRWITWQMCKLINSAFSKCFVVV